MNYIRHLNGFYSFIASRDGLSPTHVSLYMALFQFWNLNRFRNPVSITRAEVMKVSRIASVATYHRCIKDLHNIGLIIYEPSYNPLQGSSVTLSEFEGKIQKPSNLKTCLSTTSITTSKKERSRSNTCSDFNQLNEPSINNINNTNNKQFFSVVPTPHKKLKKEVTNLNLFPEDTQKEKSSGKKEKSVPRPGENIPPPKPEVALFFAEKEAASEEAEKFFNHYESNGWQVGGKSRMKNWQAAARNWLLNAARFSPTSKSRTVPCNLQATVNKSYTEKL